MKLKMVRLQIIGVKKQLPTTVQVLHRLRCVHIDDVAQHNALARSLQLDQEMVRAQESLTYLLARVDGLLALLGDEHASVPSSSKHEEDRVEEVNAGLAELSPRVQTLVTRQDALKSEQVSLPRYEATLRKLLPIVPPSAREAGNVSLGVLLSRAHLNVFETLHDEVRRLTNNRAEVIADDVDSATRAMLIVVPREFVAEVESLLGRQDISRLRLPSGFADAPPDVAIAAIGGRLAAIPAELNEIKNQFAQLAAEWRPKLEGWHKSLRYRLDEFNVLAHFGETEQTFVVCGWTPERDVASLREALVAEVGETVVLQTLSLSHDDHQRVPVALVNPALARPFESLVRLFALPSYEGIDPTILMALFLPLFFGLILGDVGYGGLILALCLGLLFGVPRFKQPGILRDLAWVLVMSSAWSIVFGVLYGEAFGELGEHFGMHPLWLNRGSPEDVVSLLTLAIGLGAAHVTLGLILGVWEAIRERSRNHLLERGGMLVGLIGLFLLVASLLKWLPSGAMTPAIAVMIVGVVLLSAALGWIGILVGPLEFVGVIGNVLSYLRIAALGLASVYLAKVANEMAGGIGSVIFGAIIAVLIHALNLALGAFSPTIHSLRLHYVEFFRKFYEGGGEPFEPFGM